MKRVFIAAIMALAVACSGKDPVELYVPKNTVEFAGNAFTAFSLGADVKLYTTPNPDKPQEWMVQGVVPVRKETQDQLSSLDIDLVPLDERGIRVRDNFVLRGEDLQNLVPVYNAGEDVERTIVFSVVEGEGAKKYFTYKEAAEILAHTKGVRMDFNAELAQPEPAQAEENNTTAAAKGTQEEFPMTLDGLCRKYGVYGLLAHYENAIKNKDKKGAKRIEDQLWSIEKKVKADRSIPESLRDRFKDYIEDKEDEIEDRY